MERMQFNYEVGLTEPFISQRKSYSQRQQVKHKLDLLPLILDIPIVTVLHVAQFINNIYQIYPKTI